MKEKWLPVKEYEGIYEVSNLGRVRSLKRYVVGRDGMRFIRGRHLRPSLNTKGYPFINLWKNNNGKSTGIHRIVAIAFCENPDSLKEVNHIDSTPINNRSDNLEWCSHLQNMQHSVRAGRTKAVTNPKRAQKLTINDVVKIRGLRTEEGLSYAKIGRRFNLAPETTRQICLGNQWGV